MTKLEICKMWNITLVQLDAQYRANAESFENMYKKALAKGKKVNGYTASQLKKMAEHYRFLTNMPFQIGDEVGYVIVENICFTGIIIDIDVDPKNKPFIIRNANGEIKYSHPEYIKKLS